jgi:predicted Fe-Mo cluster-binding NifX family protein
MLLAIPVWNDRVSPVFDTACQLLLVEVEGGIPRGRRTEEIPDLLPGRRVQRMGELGVELLICGGISRPLAMMLGAAGVRIVPWVAGPVEEVLQGYLDGQLPHPRWMMPGCLGRGHPQGGGERRRGRRGPRI